MQRMNINPYDFSRSIPVTESISLWIWLSRSPSPVALLLLVLLAVLELVDPPGTATARVWVQHLMEARSSQTSLFAFHSYRLGPLIGEDHQSCRFGVCLLMTHDLGPPADGTRNFSTPIDNSNSTSSSSSRGARKSFKRSRASSATLWKSPSRSREVMWLVVEKDATQRNLRRWSDFFGKAITFSKPILHKDILCIVKLNCVGSVNWWSELWPAPLQTSHTKPR